MIGDHNLHLVLSFLPGWTNPYQSAKLMVRNNPTTKGDQMSAPLSEIIANTSTPGSVTALTKLTKALSSASTTVEVEAAAPAAFTASGSQFRVIIGSEILVIEASSASKTTWKIIERGAEKSEAVEHLSGSSVYHYLTAGALKNWQLVKNIGNLGGVNDGVADNSSLLNKLLEEGGDIYIPYGREYAFGTTLKIKAAGTRIYGPGTLKWIGAENTSLFKASSKKNVSLPSSFVMEGVTINGNNVESTTSGVLITGIWHTFRGVTFVNFPGATGALEFAGETYIATKLAAEAKIRSDQHRT